MSDPRSNGAWVSARLASPSRAHFTDDELEQLRVDYDPRREGVHSIVDVVVIWTLLDMLEQQRGWTLPPGSG